MGMTIVINGDTGLTGVTSISSAATNTPVVTKDSSGTSNTCRAWVNFNGTLTSPISPRASFNVSSITKNATGDYTVNFTSIISDANYCVAGVAGYTQGGSSSSAGYLSLKGNTSLSTNSVSIITTYQNATTQDDGTICIAIFR